MQYGNSMRNLSTTLILAIAVIATRLPFTSKYLFNMDSVQFALATGKFDVALHQPHPPGYFLYVMMGRFFLSFTGDENTAFVAISIISSSMAVVAVYMLASELYTVETGLAAAAIAVTSPLFWMHGEVALSYMPEALMSALFAYICLRMLRGEGGLYWVAAVTLAVAGGIRQNTMVFLLPLWLYSMKGLGLRRVMSSLAIFGAALAAWFVPMLHMTGGYERYSAALKAHWQSVGDQVINLKWIMHNGYYMSVFMFWGLGISIALLAAAAYFRVRKLIKWPETETIVFLSFWLLPSILFHLIIFTASIVPGYSLIYMVGFFVVTGRALTAIPEALPRITPEAALRLKVIALSLVMAVNAIIFMTNENVMGLKIIKDHDRLVSRYIDVVRNNFSPADTEIIGSNRYYLNFRHAMYYFPEYRVHDTSIISAPGGPHIFKGEGRLTGVEKEIIFQPGTRHFVDFVNYSRADLPGLPEKARVIDLPGDNILVYYDDVAALEKVGRVAPFLGKGEL